MFIFLFDQKNKLLKYLGNISSLKNKINSSLRKKSQRRVTLMVRPLDSGLSALTRVIALLSWARHCTLTMHLSTQE